MNILGIDPGSKNCGYAIIKKDIHKYFLIEAGVIKISAKTFQNQLLECSTSLEIIIKNNLIHAASIENIFYAYNPKTLIKLAHFRGAIALKILELIGNFSEYSPLEVKKAVTGSGRASKKQVAFCVQKILNINVEVNRLDITDAMAVAITHAQRIR